MQSGVRDDLIVRQGQQGEVASEINVLAPVMNDVWLRHSMLDKHPLVFGHSDKKPVKGFFVGRLQRSRLAGETTFQANLLRELFKQSIERHTLRSWVNGWPKCAVNRFAEARKESARPTRTESQTKK